MKPSTVRALYRKLIALYPGDFREQFGESMEQTFNDCYRERDRPVVWFFVETAFAIMGEHRMNVSARFGWPALIGFFMTLPLAILEFTMNTPIGNASPGLGLLFGFIWLLATALMVAVTSRMNVLVRFPVVALLALVLVSLVADQMPCFLGVPNCD